MQQLNIFEEKKESVATDFYLNALGQPLPWEEDEYKIFMQNRLDYINKRLKEIEEEAKNVPEGKKKFLRVLYKALLEEKKKIETVDQLEI